MRLTPEKTNSSIHPQVSKGHNSISKFFPSAVQPSVAFLLGCHEPESPLSWRNQRLNFTGVQAPLPSCASEAFERYSCTLTFMT